MKGNSTVEKAVGDLAPPDEVVICSIVRGEILHGLYRLSDGKKRQTLTARANLHFADFPCTAITREIAGQYAETRSECERNGQCVSDNDLWIAATAQTLNATLITKDSDSGRIEGLRVENWTK